jgi:hypothetical protein
MKYQHNSDNNNNNNIVRGFSAWGLLYIVQPVYVSKVVQTLVLYIFLFYSQASYYLFYLTEGLSRFAWSLCAIYLAESYFILHHIQNILYATLALKCGHVPYSLI